MCKASEALYKKYLTNQYGLRVCEDDLTEEEVKDLLDDVKLLQYVSKNKFCGCDKELLIENLK